MVVVVEAGTCGSIGGRSTVTVTVAEAELAPSFTVRRKCSFVVFVTCGGAKVTVPPVAESPGALSPSATNGSPAAGSWIHDAVACSRVLARASSRTSETGAEASVGSTRSSGVVAAEAASFGRTLTWTEVSTVGDCAASTSDRDVERGRSGRCRRGHGPLALPLLPERAHRARCTPHSRPLSTSASYAHHDGSAPCCAAVSSVGSTTVTDHPAAIAALPELVGVMVTSPVRPPSRWGLGDLARGAGQQAASSGTATTCTGTVAVVVLMLSIAVPSRVAATDTGHVLGPADVSAGSTTESFSRSVADESATLAVGVVVHVRRITPSAGAVVHFQLRFGSGNVVIVEPAGRSMVTVNSASAGTAVLPTSCTSSPKIVAVPGVAVTAAPSTTPSAILSLDRSSASRSPPAPPPS